MTRFTTESEALEFIFQTYSQSKQNGLDEHTRNTTPTRNLLISTGLSKTKREYVVITGSKGKGSTAVITAKLLQHIGHKTGLITSPHLVNWYERIRINGKAIPQADFLRILSDLAPQIEAEMAKLADGQYISPQGIFLLIALRWFDEQAVVAAVVEVGRGGRYDDMALVENKVSLFTPMFLEHAQYLGDSIERIAWHKAGIIKTGSFAYSLPQELAVLNVLKQEADVKDAEFYWFPQRELGQFVADTPTGIRFTLSRYGEVEIPFLGRYQIANATLAVQAAGNMHARLQGIPHGSPEYVERIKAGLAAVRWPGRLQKLQDKPQVFIDGAINVLSVRNFLESVENRLTSPVITIAGVPSDRDTDAVYHLLAEKSDALILTETDAHPRIKFPDAETALGIAQQYHEDVQHAPTLPEALKLAYAKSGERGTVLLAVAQPLVGEAMMIWGIALDEI